MTKKHKTQVGIVGAGPAGLLLSKLLANVGIESIIIDRQDRAYIEGRIRAGVIESGSVEAIREAGIGERMDSEGLPHDGFDMCFDNVRHRIDLKGLTGQTVMVYGQTELTKDLFEAHAARGTELIFSVTETEIIEAKSDSPLIRFTKDGEAHEIECDYVAGCDGFRGPSRKSIPKNVLKTFERVYPFGWLGLLVDQPPVSQELIYSNHERGFSLCSMRSATRSRYYIQCDMSQKVEDWSDERFFDELEKRLDTQIASLVKRGPSIEKSIVPLRSFVAEPMRYGNLFLAGDAAHVVPPTGAKGLNLAIADVRLLSHALEEKFNKNNDAYIDSYSTRCLSRVWKVERFSWYMSTMLHQFPEHNPFEKRMQWAEFDYIVQSEAASRTIAENYVGLPLKF
ncbi:MAG: 4-hydroxybenzoate 3-monooxygenase [Hyphomicrobiales bacterium]